MNHLVKLDVFFEKTLIRDLFVNSRLKIKAMLASLYLAMGQYSSANVAFRQGVAVFRPVLTELENIKEQLYKKEDGINELASKIGNIKKVLEALDNSEGPKYVKHIEQAEEFVRELSLTELEWHFRNVLKTLYQSLSIQTDNATPSDQDLIDDVQALYDCAEQTEKRLRDLKHSLGQINGLKKPLSMKKVDPQNPRSQKLGDYIYSLNKQIGWRGFLKPLTALLKVLKPQLKDMLRQTKLSKGVLRVGRLNPLLLATFWHEHASFVLKYSHITWAHNKWKSILDFMEAELDPRNKCGHTEASKRKWFFLYCEICQNLGHHFYKVGEQKNYSTFFYKKVLSLLIEEKSSSYPAVSHRIQIPLVKSLENVHLLISGTENEKAPEEHENTTLNNGSPDNGLNRRKTRIKASALGALGRTHYLLRDYDRSLYYHYRALYHLVMDGLTNQSGKPEALPFLTLTSVQRTNKKDNKEARSTTKLQLRELALCGMDIDNLVSLARVCSRQWERALLFENNKSGYESSALFLPDLLNTAWLSSYFLELRERRQMVGSGEWSEVNELLRSFFDFNGLTAEGGNHGRLDGWKEAVRVRYEFNVDLLILIKLVKNYINEIESKERPDKIFWNSIYDELTEIVLKSSICGLSRTEFKKIFQQIDAAHQKNIDAPSSRVRIKRIIPNDKRRLRFLRKAGLPVGLNRTRSHWLEARGLIDPALTRLENYIKRYHRRRNAILADLALLEQLTNIEKYKTEPPATYNIITALKQCDFDIYKLEKIKLIQHRLEHNLEIITSNGRQGTECGLLEIKNLLMAVECSGRRTEINPEYAKSVMHACSDLLKALKHLWSCFKHFKLWIKRAERYLGEPDVIDDDSWYHENAFRKLYTLVERFNQKRDSLANNYLNSNIIYDEFKSALDELDETAAGQLEVLFYFSDHKLISDVAKPEHGRQGSNRKRRKDLKEIFEAVSDLRHLESSTQEKEKYIISIETEEQCWREKAALIQNVAIVLQGLGRNEFLKRKGSFDDKKIQSSLVYYMLAYSLYKSIGHKAGQARIRRYLGRSRSACSHPDSAMKHFKAARILSEEIHDYAGESSALRGLGDLYAHTGYGNDARSHYDLAIDRLITSSDRLSEGRVILSIANLERTVPTPGGHYIGETAVRLNRDIFAAECGSPKWAVESQLAKALYHVERQEIDMAWKQLLAALREAKAFEHQDRRLIGSIRELMSELAANRYHESGDIKALKDAIQHSRSVLGIYKEMNDDERDSYAINSLFNIYIGLKREFFNMNFNLQENEEFLAEGFCSTDISSQKSVRYRKYEYLTKVTRQIEVLFLASRRDPRPAMNTWAQIGKSWQVFAEDSKYPKYLYEKNKEAIKKEKHEVLLETYEELGTQTFDFHAITKIDQCLQKAPTILLHQQSSDLLLSMYENLTLYHAFYIPYWPNALLLDMRSIKGNKLNEEMIRVFFKVLNKFHDIINSGFKQYLLNKHRDYHNYAGNYKLYKVQNDLQSLISGIYMRYGETYGSQMEDSFQLAGLFYKFNQVSSKS
ncbi:hypothetical protein C4J81_12885 [Deltaproteobacteria bacterium Smac51]|nr:hypothetical protein C4J81_12885 [Deltaproteobacteria bacterium Smac51]